MTAGRDVLDCGGCYPPFQRRKSIFLSELVDFEASLCPKFRLLKLLLVLSWKVTIVNILIVVVVAAVVFVAANLKSTA